jgi:hypothetical protein
MTSPFNSPLEVGMRVLMLLDEAFPDSLDLSRLVLLDHGLLHSADLGGPASLHPDLPIRAGELGVKRRLIEQGLDMLLRAGLVKMDTGEAGLAYTAGERAHGFLRLLGSTYAQGLHERAVWLLQSFESLEEPTLREQMRQVTGNWVEEFEDRADRSPWTAR